MTGAERARAREEILERVEAFARSAHAREPFIPGKSPVPVAGRVLGAREIRNLVDAALDGWLTTGRFNDAFESALAATLGVRRALTVSSGSSANLLACSALTSPLLGGRALVPGDEVITAAMGFPTTVNPILQNQLVPVFVDVSLPTYNASPEAIEAAIGERTRAIMIAHTLGNPFAIDRVAEIAARHGLWLIEDCCDALGSTYRGLPVGSTCDLATASFYPAHHITTGEGGAVFVSSSKLRRALESLRDWGRDCWCAPGVENTCGKRFDWQLGDLPHGYDHKYTYSHLGYNLKMTDLQAAVGLAQLERLPEFVARRRENFAALRSGLSPFEDALILPEASVGAEPSWFGFPITVRAAERVSRDALVAHLDARGIATRNLFGGNLVRQPYMRDRVFRIADVLDTSDRIMRDAFWIGVYPGLTSAHVEYVIDGVRAFFER